MTVIELPDEQAAALKARAAAEGLTLEAWLSKLACNGAEERTQQLSQGQRVSGEEWARQFEEWADSFPNAPLIPDEALQRDALYPDR